MSYMCPNCRAPIELASLVCLNGHPFAYDQGILVLLEENFKRELQAFMVRLSAARSAQGKHRLKAEDYPRLPYGQASNEDQEWRLEWRLRCYDLAVVYPQVFRPGQHPPQRVLDIGAWNGWLTHRLAAQGLAVTAIDFFADEFDGLHAKKFYRAAWQAIQMDLRDLSILNETFDVVILNRCLQFFSDPLTCVAQAGRLVAPGGRMILTGLQFFRNPSLKARRVAALRQVHQEQYGVDLFLFPNRGYLDFADRQRLQGEGIALQPYPQLWLANLKAWFRPTLPWQAYGLWPRASAR